MSVGESWDRVLRWLAIHAPATAAQVLPPADPAELAATEAAFPVSWSDDLRAWYGLQNGQREDEPWGGVLPDWTTIPLDEMVEVADMYREAEGDISHLEDAPSAGEISVAYRSEFIPIGSDRAGSHLIVDMRPGPLSGCVTEFAWGEGDTRGPIWPSVEAMLTDIAESLENSRPSNGYVPIAVDGALTWELEAHPV